MARRDFIDTDDWRAFYLIHLNRYLKMKASHCLEMRAEADMIRDLIYDAWVALKTSVCLEEMGFEEKMLAFQGAEITFPLFQRFEGLCPEGAAAAPGSAVCDCACPCGSGQPFMACCGQAGHSSRCLTGIF
jgi:hypothetical protein